MQISKQTLSQRIEKIYDVLVIGGGAAGLSAGIYLQRYLLSTLVIDKGKARSLWIVAILLACLNQERSCNTSPKKVQAISVNPVEYKVRVFPKLQHPARILGWDAAGVV